MTDLTNWEPKLEWHRHGKGFLVVVKRWERVPYVETDGKFHWNVYAYIYPSHPRFAFFSGPDMWQPAANALAFHGGPSMLRWAYDDTHKPTSVQVGSDYGHLHDDRFGHYETPKDAYEVFRDAERLYKQLAGEDPDAP
jgi:hypothetical protein